MDDVSAVRRFDLDTLSTSERHALLRGGDDGPPIDDDRLRQVIADVRDGGDEALCRLALERNGVELDPSELQIADGDFVHAFERLDPERTRALEETIDRLRDFHEAEMPQEFWLKQVRPGRWAGHRYRAIDAVACYVPDGGDARAEAAVMNVIPALIANVPRVVIVTPPEADGGVSDGVLVAAATAGVGEIYKLDALAAVAALSLGTERVPKVMKLMAPRDGVFKRAFRVLGDDLEIGLSGGKGRAVVLADEAAKADGVAAALAALSASSGGRSALLVSPSARLLDAVAQAWGDGCRCDVVQVSSMIAALDVVNEMDPVHLSVFAADPMAIVSSIATSGEIALMGGSAEMRCRSSRSVFDFLKRNPISYPMTAI